MKIFIAGCARSGTTLLRGLMKCFSDIYVHPEEAPISMFDQLEGKAEHIVMKRIYSSHAELYAIPRDIALIYCIRNPYDCLTSTHEGTRHLRMFHVENERCIAEYSGLIALRHAQPLKRIFFVRYEDLVVSPDFVQQNLGGH